jgi:hypothetical protein
MMAYCVLKIQNFLTSSLLGTVHCALCTVHCVLCALCTVHCVLCTVHCVLCTVHCALCTVHCVLCTVYCILCTVHCVHQVVEFGAGEGENKEEEEGKKDPVLEAQQIAKRILGYNSSDPGRLQSVFLRLGKYQQHFSIRPLSSVPEPDSDPYNFGPVRSGSVIRVFVRLRFRIISSTSKKSKKLIFTLLFFMSCYLSGQM